MFDLLISEVEFKKPTADIISFVYEEKVRMKYFVEVSTVTTWALPTETPFGVLANATSINPKMLKFELLKKNF
jgi:hypothetical protein